MTNIFKVLNPVRAAKIAKARLNGCRRPGYAMWASEQTGVPFYIMCAFLDQESGGGWNVFGHDASIFRGAGVVTELKYKAYLKERHRTGLCQGVGPMQLTWYGYQDAADALGGCWLVKWNILEGAKILAGFYKEALHVNNTIGGVENGRWRYVAYKYNGKQTYVNSIQFRFDKWRNLVG